MEAFEIELEREFDNLDIMRYDKFECITLACNIYEMALLSGLPIWHGAMDILISKLVINESGKEKGVSVEQVYEALQFAQNYWYLRDYLWFGYNIQDSVKWEFHNTKIQIKLIDDSFQTQHFFILNNYFLKSSEVFANYSNKEKIQKLVKKSGDQFSESTEKDEAFDLCIKEAELKMENYGGFLIDDIVFHGYSVFEFKEVFKIILGRALLARYYNRKTNESNLVILEKSRLIKAFEETTGYAPEKIEAILNDVTLDNIKIGKTHGVNTFPLLYDPSIDSYILVPSCVCVCDIFNSLRKVWAFSNPEEYGKTVANIVSAELSNHISETLTSNGFQYNIQNVSLGKGVPDIDNLAIWIEEGFGNVIFIIETKNQIPESFGRDYVRSIQSKEFIVKAQKQIKEISDYLASPKFVDLLKQRFPKEVYLQELHALNFVVVTAQNVGVFLKNQEVVIIDYQTFDRIVESFEGDILHILRLLKIEEIKNIGKLYSEVVQREFKIGDYQITFPVISLKNLVKFR